jgi:hypothetical protein
MSTAITFRTCPPYGIPPAPETTANSSLLLTLFLVLIVWPAALTILARLLTKGRAEKVAHRSVLNMAAQVIAADCFALLIIFFPRALLPEGSVGGMLLMAAVMIAASVWNGDCFQRIYAPSVTGDKKTRRDLSIRFGIYSNPLWICLLIFNADWLSAAGDGMQRTGFEFFALQLAIGPLVALLICPQDKRLAMLDGLAAIRMLALAALAPVAAIEGHIIAHFAGLPMESPIFTAVWGVAAGVIMEIGFRFLYAPVLFDDADTRRMRSIIFGALANPIWPIIFFGMQGIRF